MKRARSCITSIIVFAVGLIIGLVVLGWWLWPVQWEQGNLEVVNATQQEDFLRAAIDSYSVNADQNLAYNRYTNLGSYGPQTLAEIQANPGSQNPQSIQNFTDAVVASGASIEIPATAPEPDIAASMRRVITDPKLAAVVFLGLLLIVVLVAIFFVARRGRKQEVEAKVAEEAAVTGAEAAPPEAEVEAAAPAEEAVEEEGAPEVEAEVAPEEAAVAAAAVKEPAVEEVLGEDEGLDLGDLVVAGAAAAGVAAVAGGEEEAPAEQAEAPEPEAEEGVSGLGVAAAAGLAGAVVAAGSEEGAQPEEVEKTQAEEIAEAAGWTEVAGEAQGATGVAAAGAVALAAGAVEGEPAAAEAVPVPDEWQVETGTLTESTGGTDLSDEATRLHYSDIVYVEGIGPVYGQKLKEAGVHKPADLLQAGATRKGREELAEKTGISHKLILEWVNHVDLFRIKGIGQEYADLLEAAGVDTVPELAQRNPVNLYDKLLEINAQKKLVRKVPVQSQVESWVEQAKSLPRVVSY